MLQAKRERRVFKKIYNLVFGSKATRLKKEIDRKYVEAVNFQRNGNIRMYSVIMTEVVKLEDEYERLQDS